VFACTAKPTLPLPEPELPVVSVIHGAFDVAVQVHPALAVTETDELPPLAEKPVLLAIAE
jgi:hypothetical protein